MALTKPMAKLIIARAKRDPIFKKEVLKQLKANSQDLQNYLSAVLKAIAALEVL